MSYAQDKLIMLSNPSFEGIPATSSGVPGWIDCQTYRSNRVDLQPNRLRGQMQVPAYGNSYTGLMTRDNGSTEALGQPLSRPLEPQQHYATELIAAMPIEYISRHIDPPFDNFSRPVRLQLWAGQSICDRQYLLAQTPVIQHTNWQSYRIRFSVPERCTHILLEAYYEDQEAPHYNGAVIVDFLQHISILGHEQDSNRIVSLPPAPIDTLCWSAQETFVKDLLWLRQIRDELSLQHQRVPQYTTPGRTLKSSKRGIQGVGFEPRFKLHRFYDCRDKTNHQANIGFHRIQKWMNYYHMHKLVVNIHNTEQLNRKDAEEMILRELAAAGIPLDRVDIRYQRKPTQDKNVQWIGTIANGSYTLGVN